MEKEQKKLLLVAVSVGVFLLVTITAAIVALAPKTTIAEATFTPSQPYPAGRVVATPEVTPIQPVQPEQSVVTVTEEPAATIADNNRDLLTINLPRPTTAAVPDTPELPPTSASRPIATVAQKPAQTTRTAPQASASASAARPAAQAQAARPASAAPAARTAPSRTINDFWVQTGSFRAKVRADDAKELLASKGITSIIETRDVDGITRYRVRLGPYTSEDEARYWLSLVKTINGFEESLIMQTTRTN